MPVFYISIFPRLIPCGPNMSPMPAPEKSPPRPRPRQPIHYAYMATRQRAGRPKIPPWRRPHRDHGHRDQCHQRGINQKRMDQQILPALQFITGFGNIFLFGGHVNFTISTANDFINRNQSQNRQTGPYCCAPMRLQSHRLRPGIWGRPPVTKCAPFFESGLCPHAPPTSMPF